MPDFKNPVPGWLKAGVQVMHEGESLRLGTLLESEWLDESDVAAAVLFSRWRTPQAFWNSVFAEYRRRLNETEERERAVESLTLDDVADLKAFGKELAAEGHLVSIDIRVRDHNGGCRTYTMSPDQLLKRLAELREARTGDDVRSAAEAVPSSAEKKAEP